MVPQDFQLNNPCKLDVTEGYLHIQAVLDYTFSLEEEE